MLLQIHTFCQFPNKILIPLFISTLHMLVLIADNTQAQLIVTTPPTDPTLLLPSTDGPLVPFLIEGATTLLYEVKLPGADTDVNYINLTTLGPQIQCMYKIHTDTTIHLNENCQLYLRHAKPTVPRLEGFRQVLYATILRSIALIFAQSDAWVLQVAGSNRVFVLMTELMYDEYQVGWTHWFPGHTSILLQGFPDKTKAHIMWGYSTEYVRKQNIFKVDKYYSYFMDMGTQLYREKRMSPPAGGGNSVDETEWIKYVEENKLLNSSAPFDPIKVLEDAVEANLGKPLTPPTAKTPIMNLKSFWRIEDSGCHHLLEIMKNPVIDNYVDHLALDIRDSLSFTVRVTPLTAVGRLSMYRPLFVITNSNPDILTVTRKDVYDPEERVQTARVMLSPRGKRSGKTPHYITNITVRSISISVQCKAPHRLDYIIHVHKHHGRQLWPNYPIPTCKSPFAAADEQRPWKVDEPFCTDPMNILEAGQSAQGSDDIPKMIRIKDSVATFVKLPANYRPPSARGEEIPLSSYTYNADPSKESYHNRYHVSNDTRKLRKCKLARNRNECGCTDHDKLSENPDVSDCKEMVYAVTRAKSFNISLEYDLVMRDKDQHQDFFVPKDHISVYIEEINNRQEFTLFSERTPLLDAINSDTRLHTGKGPYYNAQNITITLHGTGLFHFKAGVGKSDSFGEVIGYFTLYSNSTELNHIKLVVVMLLTITFCFSLIFLGFMRVRKRLSAQLPFQTREKTKFKME